MRLNVRSGPRGRGFFENEILVGDLYINIEDFCCLVDYFFTNTDLEENDPRLALIEKIKRYIIIEGFNPGNKRLEEPI